MTRDEAQRSIRPFYVAVILPFADQKKWGAITLHDKAMAMIHGLDVKTVGI